MTRTSNRRRILRYCGAALATGLAGCPDSTASARGVTDVVLHNEATGRRTIDVTVTGRGDESPTVETTVELAPNERRTINNEVVMGSDYEVRVAVTDGADDASPYTETNEWTDAGSPLHVIVHQQIVFAVEVG